MENEKGEINEHNIYDIETRILAQMERYRDLTLELYGPANISDERQDHINMALENLALRINLSIQILGNYALDHSDELVGHLDQKLSQVNPDTYDVLLSQVNLYLQAYQNTDSTMFSKVVEYINAFKEKINNYHE